MDEKIESNKLTEELKKAKEIIENAKLPEEFQKIAFSKMMDHLLGSNEPMKKERFPDKRRPPKKHISKVENEDAKKLQGENELIISSLSRSKYSIIYKLESALDQSLFLLQIAEKEKKIKGLTPGQISTILKDVFKIMKTPSSVSMSLMKATEYADRKKINLGGTFAYKYEIMHKGEEYINERVEKLNKGEDKNES
ncbi:MAG: hypothetical protein AABY32_03165 [Nanoarchaeota archaeon]